MTIHIHDCAGCAPRPLANYLKALGLLRLVAEQKDPNARGWWEGERFRLATTLDREGLRRFLLEEYRPTPLINPWGARSGFYSGGSEKTSREVLNEIEQLPDSATRFGDFKTAIAVARAVIQQQTGGRKPNDDKKQKAGFIQALKRQARGVSAAWLDTVAAIVGEEVHFPALFGTGGSEGSGSYCAAFMLAIKECLLKRLWDSAVDASTMGGVQTIDRRWGQSTGQFNPDGAQSPWDLLLAFEGGCLIRSSVASRSEPDARRWMSSPFYLAPVGRGYASGTPQDEVAMNKGKPMPGRGEQWFPLWDRPATVAEVGRIFSEGRASIERRRVSDGWSMARAVGSLGTSRGISAFIRYGYQQRNNMATHFAVPLGRFEVPMQPTHMLSVLDDIEEWLRGLRRASRDKKKEKAPVRLQHTERRLSDALFALVQHPDEAARWQSVLMALAGVELVMASGSGFAAGPVPRLRPDWAVAADDGSTTFRLALSCAMQVGEFRRDGHPIDEIRRHALPLKGSRFNTRSEGLRQRLLSDPGVVMAGRDGTTDAIALVMRRLVESAQKGGRRLPLQAARNAAARLDDLAALVAGDVDLDRVLLLARGLMAINAVKWAENPPKLSSPPVSTAMPDDAWLAIRLALLPWPLPDGRRIGTDPAIVRRLAAGDAGSALDLALRRLRVAGITATIRGGTADPTIARRWAAALAFPITPLTAAHIARRLDPKTTQENTHAR